MPPALPKPCKTRKIRLDLWEALLYKSSLPCLRQ